MSESIKKIQECFETLLNNIWEYDYKDDNGYEVRITENISAQLIDDVNEAIDEALETGE
jgi:hypothetical protein